MNTRSSRRQSPRSIADKLRGDIVKGVFPISSQLPIEAELCKQFGASRYAVREALRVLTEEGLIERRPRVGSVVISTRPAGRFVQSVSTMHKLLNYPEGTVRKTIGTGYVEASADLARLLGCKVGERWFRIKALRYAVGSSVPLCYTDIYILAKYASIVNHPNHHYMLVSDQITEVFGVRAERTLIEISASSIKPSIARLLNVEPKTPALMVTRRYATADGENFEVTFAAHPETRYNYVFEFRRET